MNSKEKTSKSKSSEWSFGGGWFGENGSEDEQEVSIPEVKHEEKKGGKTKKVFKFGSRRQVWNGSAEMTPGRLRKEHLIRNDRGRIVSVKRHSTMKQRHTNE